MDDKPLRDSRERFCTVSLPLPNCIRSERLVNAKERAFAGKDAAGLHLDSVAMVQVFIYEALDDAELQPSPGWQRKTDAGLTANLHFHAEPKEMVSALHSVEAYLMMAEMFGLEIVPIRELFVKAKDPDPPITGIKVEDLLGLHEPPGAGALSGSNWDSLVIHNHPKL